MCLPRRETNNVKVDFNKHVPKNGEFCCVGSLKVRSVGGLEICIHTFFFTLPIHLNCIYLLPYPPPWIVIIVTAHPDIINHDPPPDRIDHDPIGS